jgi:hypothetical protein
MIAENESAPTSSPGKRESRDQGLFETLDDAVARLYPSLHRIRRLRIRAVADVVDGLGEDTLAEPESLTQAQLLRLGTALRAGLGDLIQHALAQSSETSPKGQWRVLPPIIEESEEDAREASRPAAESRTRRDYKPGHPPPHRPPKAGT